MAMSFNNHRLPYQSRPELDALPQRQQERAAAELYSYKQQSPSREAADLEQRPVYEWVSDEGACETSSTTVRSSTVNLQRSLMLAVSAHRCCGAPPRPPVASPVWTSCAQGTCPPPEADF